MAAAEQRPQHRHGPVSAERSSSSLRFDRKGSKQIISGGVKPAGTPGDVVASDVPTAVRRTA